MPSIVLPLTAVDLLTVAMRNLPVGTADAVLTGTGIGSIGTVVSGVLVAGDPPTLSRLGPIGLILAGVILLRLLAEH